MLISIWRDFRAIRGRDPAARWFLDRLLCYPGFHALVLHRIAHILWVLRLRLFARVVGTITRFLTGVDIHPGAKIGPGTVIDHAQGVVIGETSVVGENVTLFQGVTLGGTGKTRGKRHPTIGNGVVIGAGAKVLGDITIGEGARVGSGSVVVRDVPPGATVVGIPGRIVMRDGVRIEAASLDHGDLPDPIREALTELAERLHQDEERFLHEQTILEEIATHKRGEVLRLKRRSTLDELKKQASEGPAVRGFKEALDADGLSLIGEIKHASPSAGIIRRDFVPAELARAYERAGARALSVLTDRCYFEGALEHLKEARGAASLPVLRKEFIIDEVQLYEARAAGADAVLLIARLLTEERLAELLCVSRGLGMATLVEVHEKRELGKVIAAEADIVGVNNRDLATFEVRLETTLGLADDIPDDVTLVSESGIRTREDLARLVSAGVDAVLIGETFMRAQDVEAKVREVFGS